MLWMKATAKGLVLSGALLVLVAMAPLQPSDLTMADDLKMATTLTSKGVMNLIGFFGTYYVIGIGFFLRLGKPLA